MMFGLDATKKKKLSKVAKDKAAAAAATAKSASTSSLQRSASTRVPSTSSSRVAGAAGWDSSLTSSSRSRGKVFEWIDDEGRTSSPPPAFSTDQMQDLLVDLDRGSGLGLTLRGGSDHGLGIFVSSVDAGTSAAEAGFRVGDQVLSLNGMHWAKIVDDDESAGGTRVEPGMRLETAVQSILRATQSSRTLRFGIRSTGKVPSASVIRSSASMIHRRPSRQPPGMQSASTGTGDGGGRETGTGAAADFSSAGSGLSSASRKQSSSSPTNRSTDQTTAINDPSIPASAYVRKKSLIPFSRCSFRSDSRISTASSASTSESTRRQREQPAAHQAQQQQSQSQSQMQLSLAAPSNPDPNRRLSTLEMSPITMPSSPMSPIPPQMPMSQHQQSVSRHPSFSAPVLTPFDLELRRILTESESGTFYYFRNEYLLGRLPVTSLVNFLKQFLDRIDHRHALIRLVHEYVIRAEEKDLFYRMVAPSFASQQQSVALTASFSQYDPRRQSSVPALTAIQAQRLMQSSADRGLSSDEEEIGHQNNGSNSRTVTAAAMMMMEGANSESKRRLSTRSVTSIGNEEAGGNSNNGSTMDMSAVSRNRRCSSLRMPGSGKRILPGIPLTASDLNLNPGTANPRRASILSNISAGGHHLLPIPPPLKQQLSSQLTPPTAASLMLKRHSTSRIESSTLGVPALDEGQRRHSSSALGVNQQTQGKAENTGTGLQQQNCGMIPMIMNISCESLAPGSRRSSFVPPGIGSEVSSGRSSGMSNQLLVPSVNVRRSSVDVDRNSSGDETDPDSRLQLPPVSQLRRGSGNHLMIPGEEDATPPLYLLLPQVSTGTSGTRRGSNVQDSSAGLVDQFGNQANAAVVNYTTACHTRVRRHRSLPSPFISGAHSAVPSASVSPPVGSVAGGMRRPSGIPVSMNSNAQMTIANNAGRRMSVMQSSAAVVNSGRGDQSSTSGGVVRSGAGVTLVQGYCSPQEQQQQSSHRRSSSFRRPLHRSTIESGGRVRVHVKKCKPFLGIAIEGGSNVKMQTLPRIISILGNGAAFESGDLHIGHIILEVDCISTEGLRHEDVAQMMADAYYKTPHKDYIELLVREKKRQEFDIRHSSIIILNSTFE